MASKMIQYEDRTLYAEKPTFRTPKYGNLLSDTYQGEVDLGHDGTWCGWFHNMTRPSQSAFRLGFRNKAAATRWVNQQLRECGI